MHLLLNSPEPGTHVSSSALPLLARVQLRMRGRRWGRAVRDGCYVFLATTGWLAGNLLAILGCAVAMFIVISHGRIDAFFLHVDNLAARYVTADLGRRALFEHQLVQVFTIVLLVTLLMRGPRFIARVRRALADGRSS